MRFATTHSKGIRMLGLLAVILSFFFLVNTPAEAASRDKVMKLALASDVTSLDPHVQLSEETIAYSHWVFDPLVRWDKNNKIVPHLAKSWEQVSPTTMRFHLQEGVKFHSGNDMTAKDVVWTLNRLRESTEYKALYEPFTEATIVDDHTVDLNTVRPYGLILNMATYIFVMDSQFYTGVDASGQDKAFINKTGPSFANTNVSGSGPFKVESREQGVRMVLKAFPEYWGNHGNIGTLDILTVKNDATRVASLLSGTVDMILPVPTQDYDRMDKEKNIQLVTMSSTRIITVQLNQKRNEALANPKVREAIIAATDNSAISKVIMKGYSEVASQQPPAHMPGHNSTLGARYDLNRAKALLQEAGYGKGLELSMIAPNNRYVNDEKIAQAFVAMMAKAGIKVALKTMPRNQYWDEFDAQVADLQLIGWHPDTEDAANYSEYLLMCPNAETGYGQYNSGNYCNQVLDDLVMAAQTETDMVKRTAMLEQIEKIAYDDAAFVPLHYEPLGWAANLKLKNFEEILNPQNFPYLGDLVME